MGLVLHSNLKGTIPSIQLDVKFDSSIEETMLDQNLLSLRNAFLVYQHCGLSSWLAGQLLLDMIYVLDLVSLVDLR